MHDKDVNTDKLGDGVSWTTLYITYPLYHGPRQSLDNQKPQVKALKAVRGAITIFPTSTDKGNHDCLHSSLLSNTASNSIEKKEISTNGVDVCPQCHQQFLNSTIFQRSRRNHHMLSKRDSALSEKTARHVAKVESTISQESHKVPIAIKSHRLSRWQNYSTSSIQQESSQFRSQ